VLFNQPAFTTFRTARATLPGDHFPAITFQEFGGVDRKPVHHSVMDPGGPILPVTVTDYEAALADVQPNGGTVVQGLARASWIRDPNGVLLRLGQPAPPRSGSN
jgi:predicted enzyme related to lactoylglutathione lyase